MDAAEEEEGEFSFMGVTSRGPGGEVDVLMAICAADDPGFPFRDRNGRLIIANRVLLNGQVLRYNHSGWTPLHAAAFFRLDDMVLELVHQGAQVDPRDNLERTPLFIACTYGYENVVEALLDRGADANAQCQDGFTPLHMACDKNHIGVAQLLLQHGADVNATNYGMTPSLIAMTNEYFDLMHLLLINGAHVSFRNLM